MDHEPTTPRPITPNRLRWAGGLAALLGLYFVLIGIGQVPVPGDPRHLHAPLWVIFLVGVAFFLAGWAALIQAFGRADGRGALPPGAPQWLHITHYFTGVMILACFALITSWAAIADGPIKLSRGFALPAITTDTMTGRVAFGLGAIIAWACTVAYAVSGWRALSGRDES